MELARVPDLRTDEQGVTFRYLVFKLISGDAEKTLVRGLNYLPYDADLNQRIVNRTFDELEEAGFDADSDQLLVEGGGTLTLNPYDESATIFGENPEYGEESNRAAVEALVKEAYPDYEVSSFRSGEELPPPPKPKRPPRKKPAVGSESPETESEEDETLSDDSESEEESEDEGSEEAEAVASSPPTEPESTQQ